MAFANRLQQKTNILCVGLVDEFFFCSGTTYILLNISKTLVVVKVKVLATCFASAPLSLHEEI